MTPERATEWERITDLLDLRRRLLASCGLCILVGALNAIVGVMYLPAQDFYIFTLLHGIMLSLVGIGVLYRPAAGGFVLNGLLLLIVGIWDVLTLDFDNRASQAAHYPLTALGILSILIAPYLLFAYFQALPLFQERFAEEDIRRIKQLLRHLQKARPEEATDVIALRTYGSDEVNQWIFYLGEDFALCMNRTRSQATVASKEDITIEGCGPSRSGKALQAIIRFRGRIREGVLSHTAYAKFQAWKISDKRREVEPAENGPQSHNEGYTAHDQIQSRKC
jgi:hypothetical protein